MAVLVTESEIMDAVLRILAKRDYSEMEIRRKLQSRQAPEVLVDRVIKRVQELGYQSDERYVGAYIRYSVSQGRGPVWIFTQLSQRGIAKSMIQQGLEAIDIDWRDVAAEQLRRKFKVAAHEPKLQAKQFRHLASRGFSSDVIRFAMDALAVETFVD